MVDGRPHVARRVADAQGRQHVPGVLPQPGGHSGAPRPQPADQGNGPGRPYALRAGQARLPAAHGQGALGNHRHAGASPAVRADEALPYVGHPPVPLLREAERRHEVGGSGRARPGRLGSTGAASGLRPVRCLGDHDGRGDRGLRLPVGRGGHEPLPSAVRPAGLHEGERLLHQAQPEGPAGSVPPAGLRLGRRGLAGPPDDLRCVPDVPHRPGRGQATHRRGAGSRRDRGGERRGHGDQPLVRSDRADRHRQPGRPVRPPRSDRRRLDR